MRGCQETLTHYNEQRLRHQSYCQQNYGGCPLNSPVRPIIQSTPIIDKDGST